MPKTKTVPNRVDDLTHGWSTKDMKTEINTNKTILLKDKKTYGNLLEFKNNQIDRTAGLD